MFALAAAFLIIGTLLLTRGVSRTRLRRRLSGSVYWSSGIGTLAIGAVLVAVAINLTSYHTLTREMAVADVSIVQSAKGQYQLTLQAIGSPPLTFTVSGDEWQMDARFLRWKSWATLMGKEPMYRLERLSGRYSDIEQERNADRTLYALSDGTGLDLWRVSRNYSEWIPLIDAYYGSSVYVPLADKASYQVTASNDGLLVRPKNQAAENVLKKW